MIARAFVLFASVAVLAPSASHAQRLDAAPVEPVRPEIDVGLVVVTAALFGVLGALLGAVVQQYVDHDITYAGPVIGASVGIAIALPLGVAVAMDPDPPRTSDPVEPPDLDPRLDYRTR